MTTTEQDVCQHELYRMFNAEKSLIYVGISKSFTSRLGAHRQDKDWWNEVATITIEHFPTKLEAELAEALVILTENPRYNRQIPSQLISDEVMNNPSLLPELLTDLAHWGEQLNTVADEYQQAILKARAAGATWGQMARTMGLSEGGARARMRAASTGGLITIQLKPPAQDS